MKLTEWAVKKPIPLIVVTIIALGLGILSYTNLGSDLVPSLDFPALTITTTYIGAGADEINSNVIKPIEDAISGISSVESIRSNVAEGYGYSLIMMKMGTDLDKAVMDIQQALNNVEPKLPKDASRPVLSKTDRIGGTMMTIAISGNMQYDEVSNQAKKLRDLLQKVEGVGNVTLIGAENKELQVKINKKKIDEFGISINNIINKIMAENLNLPVGVIQHGDENNTVRVFGEFKNIDELKNITIPLMTGKDIHLSEVADINLAYPDSKQLLRLNGNSSLGLQIQKKSNANLVRVAKRIKSELNDVKKTFPSEINIRIVDDSSGFVNATLGEVNRNLLEAIITTSLILFLFLRRWKSSLIVLVAIPTALVSTFFMMYIMGFTLNLLSLLALTTSIGILVDDSIVILENIQRHMGMGKSAINAAIDARKEIGMAAIAITLCDIVVFAPVAFLSDIVGKFFREFGLTVVCASVLSLIVSFTITPMLSTKLFRKEATDRNKGKKESSRVFNAFLNLYKRVFIWSLSHRWLVLLLMTAGVTLSVLLLPTGRINMEFLPVTDQSKLQVNIQLPSDSDIQKTDEKVKEIEAHLKEVPEVKEYYSVIGGDKQYVGNIYIILSDKKMRKKSQGAVARDIRIWGKSLNNVSFSINENSIFGQSVEGKPLVVNITGLDKIALSDVSNKVEKLMKNTPGVIDIQNSANMNSEEVSIEINHDKAGKLNITTYDIATTLRAAIAGQSVSMYKKNGEEYGISVEFNKNDLKSIEDIQSIYITNTLGQRVQLKEFATVSKNKSLPEVMKLDRQNLFVVSANIQGRVLSSITNDIKKGLKTINIPKGVDVNFGGDEKYMADSFDSLIKALIASILLVYLILVMLYESFLTPFIRMLSLPCGVIGALLGLYLTGNSLNIVSMIGIIMLDGIASKNGTLLVDYTNTLMKRGMPLKEAIIEAGVTRFRPILMTSATMIVGMMPTALALGEGSELKAGMAVVLVGGMISSTIFTPILIPVVYTLIDDLKKKTKQLLSNGRVFRKTSA